MNRLPPSPSPRIAAPTATRATFTAAIALLMALAGCGGGGDSAGAPAQRTSVTAVDSITLQSGACAPGQALSDCREDYWPHPERAYANFIGSATDGAYVVLFNAGRSGDSCTAQEVYSLGPFLGEPRGLVGRLQTSVPNVKPQAVSVLIGINDVNDCGVSVAQTTQCIVQAWNTLHAAGVQVIAMTYPPLSPTTHAWPLPDGVAAQNALALNQAVRTAWADWSATHEGGRLVDSANAWAASAVDAMTVDGVHPTPAGALEIAKTWR